MMDDVALRSRLACDEGALIRVERGAEVRPGIYAWTVRGLGLEGRSRQPLLDACRKIKSILADGTPCYVAIYRQGHDEWDARCSLDWGAAHTVTEESAGSGLQFRKWEPFKPEVRHERA